MRCSISDVLARLQKLVVLLAALSSGAGLFHLDAARSSHVVTLLVIVPMLAWSSARIREGSVRARVLQLGVLHGLIHESVVVLCATAIGPRFFAHAALAVVAFWALVLGVRAIPLARLPRPRARGVAAWMLFVALALTTVALFSPAASRWSPELHRATAALALIIFAGVLVPGAVLVRRRQPSGVLIAASLGVSVALVQLVVVGAALVQTQAGDALAWSHLGLALAIAGGSALAAALLLRRPAVCFSDAMGEAKGAA